MEFSIAKMNDKTYMGHIRSTHYTVPLVSIMFDEYGIDEKMKWFYFKRDGRTLAIIDLMNIVNVKAMEDYELILEVE